MTDVRLTAINPADSSVVPVACNDKGELLLEEPQVVEGPPGPAGDKGDKGDPGDPFAGNFADDVTFGGTATFASDITVNSLVVGRGLGNDVESVAFGNDALAATTTGGSNVALGLSALKANTEGSSNTAVGRRALFSNTTGQANVAVGTNSLHFSVDGIENTACGVGSLYKNQEGSTNTAVGHRACYEQTEGFDNTGVGKSALNKNNAGSRNIGIGAYAGLQLQGSSNTFIGSHQGAAGLSNTISISTGEVERIRMNADDAIDFNQKCGFTADGGLWITDNRGNTYRTTFAANDFMQWEPYTVPTRNEPQMSAEQLRALEDEEQAE